MALLSIDTHDLELPNPNPSHMIEPEQVTRRLPIGAEPLTRGGTHFRVWAPDRSRVDVVLIADDGSESHTAPLRPERDGYFSRVVPDAHAGTLYRFRLDGDEATYPDPASRFQPEGPHGPSQVVDPADYEWRDTGWPGLDLAGQVLYEMHIGTFTPEGTWSAAAARLPDLVDVGVTVLEVMPVADFPGSFGWGYDGVNLFAPCRLYGTPDDFRRFVDLAHSLGLAVILDVVYNHFGPSGNYLDRYSASYRGPKGEWGDSINYDGPGSDGVREFVVANAAYWIDEFHLDGLRLDATQQIFDRSVDHILAALTRRVREAASGRKTIVIAENEPQDVRLMEPPDRGGFGIDGLWNDDFHHAARVTLTGRREAYYTDFLGTPQELVSAAKHGFLYQGQPYSWQGKRRGTPTAGIPPHAFIAYLENHDQIANSGTGARLHQLTSPGRHRAMTALLLLGPWTPLLFQGQEFSASSPFLYFADHEPPLAEAVRRGRAEFLAQFDSLATPDAQRRLRDPGDRATFELSKLDHGERNRNEAARSLHRDLIRLRREDPVLSRGDRRGVDGAVLTPTAFVLRFDGCGEGDRLLVINLGRDVHLTPAPEPLLAPPRRMRWEPIWSSDDPRYGGTGGIAAEVPDGWRIPAESTTLFAPAPDDRSAGREPEATDAT